MEQYDRKQREVRDAIEKFKAQMSSMETKFKNFEADYLAMTAKAESEAAIAEQLCPRVPVTR